MNQDKILVSNFGLYYKPKSKIKLQIMKANHSDSEQFDENQSLRIIQKMIQLSKRKLRNDGILLIVWGYAASLPALIKYFKEILFLPNRVMFFLKLVDPVLPLLALAFTIFHIYHQSKK